MLWLEWEGEQLPIGWDSGPAATIDSVFGTSWKVYEGVSTGNGMTVVSLLLTSLFAYPDLRLFRKSDLRRQLVLHFSTREKVLITVFNAQHSMLPDTHFSGFFAGDLKDWFDGLVKVGRFTDNAYVNIGNAG